MGRIFLNLGVLSALWGGISAVRKSKGAPKDWKFGLTMAGAAISIVLAVTGAVDAAREAAEAAEDDEA